MSRHARPLIVLLAGLLVACGSTESPPAKPHGYVEGAKETAEQQSRLLLADPTTGDAQVLDLITEKSHELPRVAGVERLTTDGRFGFFHTARDIAVVDSGAWMVDHGDHVHYYRAKINGVGKVSGTADTQVFSDAAVAAVTSEDDARLIDRRKLEDGAVAEPRTLDGEHAGVVAPYAGHLIAPTESSVLVYDREGQRRHEVHGECANPSDAVTTKRGVVFPCDDGALLVREDDGKFAAQRIPYGTKVPAGERATDLRNRPGSDTLTALAGDDAVWVLDLADKKWDRVDTGKVVAANTAGVDTPLLTVTPSGTLRGFDIDSGKPVAKRKLLSKVDSKQPPVIEVDNDRAYVNDPAAKRVHEIDYNDDLRVARKFDTDVTPSLMVETGR